MNVLIVIRWPVGGIQTYCRYIYETPIFGSCRFTVVTTAEADEQYFRRAFGSNLDDLVRLDDRDFSAAAIFKAATNIRALDLIHAHGFSSAILSAPAKVLRGVPLILTSHDIIQDSQFRGVRGRLKKYALGGALRASTHVNAVGYEAGENLKAYFPRACSAKRYSVILNGIDVERFANAKSRDLRTELGLRNDVILLGFFGRFMAQKGFRFIREMLSQHVQQLQARVHVACFGWGGFIREEQATIARDGLTPYFSFFPATDDMPAALRGCDAVLMPSLWEAMPLLAMETLVAGVPLIASACIGLREVCEGSPALTCAPADSRSLLDALNRFVADRTRHVVAAEGYRGTAIARFDRRHAAAELLKLYQRVVRR